MKINMIRKLPQVCLLVTGMLLDLPTQARAQSASPVSEVFQLSIEVSNNYVNTSSTSLHLYVTGDPSYVAVLVDNDNKESANWQPFNSNITVSLGSTEGWHGILVGLKGSSTGARQCGGQSA
jgi:hypothetical protein